MKNKIILKISIILMFIVLITVQITIISSQNINISSGDSQRIEFGKDAEKMITALEKGEWIQVIVELKDESGIILSGTKQEKIDQVKQKLEWYKSKIDEVLKDYSDENIRSVEKMSRGFSAVINREGFDKMVKDTRILKISANKQIYPDDNSEDELIVDLENETDNLYIKVGFIIFILLIFILLIILLNKKKN